MSLEHQWSELRGLWTVANIWHKRIWSSLWITSSCLSCSLRIGFMIWIGKTAGIEEQNRDEIQTAHKNISRTTLQTGPSWSARNPGNCAAKLLSITSENGIGLKIPSYWRKWDPPGDCIHMNIDHGFPLKGCQRLARGNPQDFTKHRTEPIKKKLDALLS